MRTSLISALICAVVIGLALVVISSGGFRAFRGSPVDGTWHSDVTDVMNEIYSRHGMIAKNASATTTFHRGGSCTNECTATLIAVAGPGKDRRAAYVEHAYGTFTFQDGGGMIRVAGGKCTVNGNQMPVRLPEWVSLKLQDDSTLMVVEDFSKEGRFHFLLKRQ